MVLVTSSGSIYKIDIKTGKRMLIYDHNKLGRVVWFKQGFTISRGIEIYVCTDRVLYNGRLKIDNSKRNTQRYDIKWREIMSTEEGPIDIFYSECVHDSHPVKILTRLNTIKKFTVNSDDELVAGPTEDIYSNASLGKNFLFRLDGDTLALDQFRVIGLPDVMSINEINICATVTFKDSPGKREIWLIRRGNELTYTVVNVEDEKNKRHDWEVKIPGTIVKSSYYPGLGGFVRLDSDNMLTLSMRLVNVYEVRVGSVVDMTLYDETNDRNNGTLLIIGEDNTLRYIKECTIGDKYAVETNIICELPPCTRFSSLN